MPHVVKHFLQPKDAYPRKKIIPNAWFFLLKGYNSPDKATALWYNSNTNGADNFLEKSKF